MNITVERLSDLDASRRREAASVFFEGYRDSLASISTDEERWVGALAPAFVPQVFYVALEDGDILGIAACAHGTTRAVRLDPAALRTHLGVVRGTFAYLAMRGSFHRRLPYPDTTGYVECVATAERARGRGVATRLMGHIHALPFEEFVLEVTDVNAGARRLYERLGYREFERRTSRFPRLTGYHEAVYLRRGGHA